MSDSKKDGPEKQSAKRAVTLDFSESPVTDTISDLRKAQTDHPELFPLLKAVEDATGKKRATSKAPALSFMESSSQGATMSGLVKSKQNQIPDDILKLIRVQDHLVAGILRTRGGQVSQFGTKREDRFAKGLELAIDPAVYKVLTTDQFEKVIERMKRLETILLNCGHTANLESQQQMTLATFLDIQVRNALTFGWMTTEVIYDRSGQPDSSGRYPFHRFRPNDAGTIYKTVRNGESTSPNVRILAIQELERLTGEKIDIDWEKLKEDRYAWAQIVENGPTAKQYFTHEELLVHDFYPSTDVERNGYPVPPIETVIQSITTHISIDTWKRLYFQNGRATRGALVIKSEDIDDATLEKFRQEFQASINGVHNSFRTPIMGMGPNEGLEWVPFAGEKADDSFEYIYDQIARNILSTFQMSPDEVPGYGHLSKGTNSQTLSESNNEFKLTAARDSGLNPIIQQFENFFNQRLIPIIDPLLAKIVTLRFKGMDADSKEQESTRLQQDQPTHMAYDEVLNLVDKKPIGTGMGGEVPFNERWQLLADKYLDVGAVKARFYESPAAMADPMLRYKRDPFALQFLQLMSQTSPNTLIAYFAPKPHALEFLKLEIKDMIEEDDE